MSNSTKAKKLAQAASEFRSYDDEGNECWEVETILDRKYSRSARDFLYLVKWNGWRIEDSTWEPVENLLGSLPMLEEFEKNFQELVVPLEPAYAIIGPESKPITIDDLKKSKISPGVNKASPLSKTKKDTHLSSDRKLKKQVESKQKKEEKVSNKANNIKKSNKKSKVHRNETPEALTTDSSSHRPERPKGVVLNESLGMEVKAEILDKEPSQAQMENVEIPEIRIQAFQFGPETTCKQEPSDDENRAVIPIAARQENTGLKNNGMTNNILGESQMNEKGVDNGSQSNENQVDRPIVGSPMLEEVSCSMEVEPHNTNMEHSESLTPAKSSGVTEQTTDISSPVNETEPFASLTKEPSNILVGGLVANFSSSKSLTMPDQVCFGRSEMVPHFEQPKPKIMKSNGLGCGFFTEKTKGLSRKQAGSDGNQNLGDTEFDFYSPPSKFQNSSWNESSYKNYNGGGIRLNGKLVEPNRVRYKQEKKPIPDVGFDWKDIMQWANSNRIVVGAVSEMKNKIRKAMEAEERKARRQKNESESERSESKKKTNKRNKIRSRGTRTEEKSDAKKGSERNRELSRDQERDKRENSVVSKQEKDLRRKSRRFQKEDSRSELQLDDILSAARRKKRQRMRNGEALSLSLDPEDDDFDGIKLHLELNFGFEDEQKIFGSEEGFENNNNDDNESSGWGLGTTIFVESNTETEFLKS